MGLERLVTVLQGRIGVRTRPAPALDGHAVRRPVDQDEQSLRLLTDHLRSSVVVIGDGVPPSSTGRGYVLRRLVRRALTTLWRDDPSRTLGDLPARAASSGTLDHFGQLGESGQVSGRAARRGTPVP